jgi:aspartyl-tRNA(Asn)/glutamyl-tRNA(Gln) amidotransferase subunit B
LIFSSGNTSPPARSLSVTRPSPIPVMEYESVIGLEVHAQLLTDSKISGEFAPALIEKKGLRQISDAAQLQSVIGEVLSENQENLRKYYAGKDKLFGFFVGEVMKKTKRQADPKLVSSEW